MADTEKGFNLSESCILGMTYCFPWSAFPDTAVIGDTFAACFAGAFAAISTVISPTKIPQAMPKILIPKRGMSENSSLTTKRSTAHSPHVVTTPKIRPMGTAVLHQFNASRRTNRIICCLLIPMQRIIPKKFGSLGNAAVHTAGNHQNACNQNQQEQNNRDRKKGLSH